MVDCDLDRNFYTTDAALKLLFRHRRAAADHECLCLIPKNHACFSYLSHNSEFFNKATTKKSHLTKVERFLLALTLMHQKGAVSYELTYGQ